MQSGRSVMTALNIETQNWVKRPINLNSLFFDYFGINAEKYAEAQEYFQSHSGNVLWNWSAALMGPVWLFYRKMYALLVIWMLIGLSFDFIYFVSPLLGSDFTNPLLAIFVKYYGPLSLFFVVMTNIFLGCWGNYFYLRQAQRMVNRVKAHAPNTIAAVILSEKGNPSRWRLAGGVLLLGGTYFSTYLLACIWLIMR
jgi:hypothetical protein